MVTFRYQVNFQKNTLKLSKNIILIVERLNDHELFHWKAKVHVKDRLNR